MYEIVELPNNEWEVRRHVTIDFGPSFGKRTAFVLIATLYNRKYAEFVKNAFEQQAAVANSPQSL
jgi:hypothetical protein